MNRITVALDLNHSVTALVDYAMHLARGLKAELYLLHVHHYLAGSKLVPSSFLSEGDGLGQLRTMAQVIHEETQGEVQVSFGVEYGSKYRAIAEATATSDLLVIGQTPSFGMWRPLGADTTGGVIEHAECPVLIIPDDLAWTQPHRIALAINERRVDAEAFGWLSELIGHYAPRLDVFYRDAEDSRQARRPHPSLGHAFDEAKFTYHFDVGEGDITDYILASASGIGADWVVLVHHRHTWWRQLFHQDTSEHVVAVASLPVLVLEDFRQNTPVRPAVAENGWQVA